MRAYVAVTGGVFALIVVAHVWRMSVEPGIGRQPDFLVITAAAAGMAAWAGWLVIRRRSGG